MKQGKGSKRISETFAKWLLFCLAAALVVTTAFIYVLQTRLSENDSDRLLRLNIADVQQDIMDASDANLLELAQQMETEKTTFSDSAKRELSLLCAAVYEILDVTVNAFESNDNEMAKRIEPLEETIDDMVMILKDRHTKRLKNGTCSISSGLVFMESLTHLERVADHCSSIGVMMLARGDEKIFRNHHKYLQEIHSGADAGYADACAKRRAQYLDPLMDIQ